MNLPDSQRRWLATVSIVILTVSSGCDRGPSIGDRVTILSAQRTNVPRAIKSVTTAIENPDRSVVDSGEVRPNHHLSVVNCSATPPPTSPAGWAADAIFYQSFPERFCNGDPTNDPTRDSLEYQNGVPESWQI